MSRFTCPQCSQPVSPTASECPSCGRVLSPARGPAARLIGKTLVGVGVIGLVVSVAGEETAIRRWIMIVSMTAVLGGLLIWTVARRFR